MTAGFQRAVPPEDSETSPSTPASPGHWAGGWGGVWSWRRGPPFEAPPRRWGGGSMKDSVPHSAELGRKRPKQSIQTPAGNLLRRLGGVSWIFAVARRSHHGSTPVRWRRQFEDEDNGVGWPDEKVKIKIEPCGLVKFFSHLLSWPFLWAVMESMQLSYIGYNPVWQTAKATGGRIQTGVSIQERYNTGSQALHVIVSYML